jgi:hypothetical protein
VFPIMSLLRAVLSTSNLHVTRGNGGADRRRSQTGAAAYTGSC